MKRAFHFRLARVARVREVFEEEARAEFTLALREQHRAEARYQAARAGLIRGHEAQADAQCQGQLDVRALLARERALLGLEEELHQAHAGELEARRASEDMRAAWQVRRGERQALEELAQRHKERHGMDVSRMENAEIDEVASQRFSHEAS